MNISLDLVGPFSFMQGSNSIFSSPFSMSSGIYLWTVKQRRDNTHLIHYVGETTRLEKRHREHSVQILGLNYGIFDPKKAQEGIRELIWNGLWRDKSPEGPTRLIEAYQDINKYVIPYVSILNIFFAELDVDNRLRKHIEGCIGWNLRNNHPEFKALYPDDNHVGSIKEKERGVLLISSSEVIQGLDSQIQY